MFKRDNISVCVFLCHSYPQSHRYDTHLMMALVHGNVRECAARLALAEQMMKVHSTVVHVHCWKTPLYSMMV